MIEEALRIPQRRCEKRHRANAALEVALSLFTLQYRLFMLRIFL